MIMICERCYAPIGEGESLVRLAHIDRAYQDGSIDWVHAYVHLDACVASRVADHERPDTGTWDQARGIGGYRH